MERIGVVDWNAFVPLGDGGVGVSGIRHIVGRAWRFGVARTLGGDTNQVAAKVPNQRHVLIGRVIGRGGRSLQSLPQDPSIGLDGELQQRLVPELPALRRKDTTVAWRGAACGQRVVESAAAAQGVDRGGADRGGEQRRNNHKVKFTGLAQNSQVDPAVWL